MQLMKESYSYYVIFTEITISPSVVDLDSNVTFYTVSCRLDNVQDGLDSSSLFIELQNERIKSEVSFCD